MVFRYLCRDTRVHMVNDIEAVELQVEEGHKVLAGHARWKVVYEQTPGLTRVGGLKS